MPRPPRVPRLLQVLTARGVLTSLLGLLCLVAGVVWDYPLVAGVGAVLVVLVVTEAVSVVASGDVVVRREVSPIVVVRHERCRAYLHVTGRRRRGLVRLEASDRIGGPEGQLVPVRLPEGGAGDAVSVDYAVPTTRRGLLDVGPVRLRRYSVTGMAASSSDVGTVDRIRVLPRRITVGALPAGRRRAVAGADVSMEIGGTDLTGLHEYTMGDDLRRLHWATSARTGTLMVREDADPSEPHVCVLLDDRLASYVARTDALVPGSGPEDAFEEAVEMAAALCRTTVDQGSPLTLATLSGRHDVSVPGSPTRQQGPEAQELEWILAEIDAVAHAERPVPVAPGAYDVVVAVSGGSVDELEVGALVGDAATRVLCVVEPAPMVASEQRAGTLVLRGSSSLHLADSWARAVSR